MKLPAILSFFILLDTRTCANEKYEYGMFENFVVTESVFLKEMELVKELQSVKKALETRRAMLLSPTYSGLAESGEEITARLDTMKELSRGFPKYPDDMVGAFKGMLVLRDTYNLPLRDFIRGEIRTSLPHPLSFSSRYHLNSQDLTSLAVTAFERKWYDSSILYLREAIRQLDSEQEQPGEFHETLRRHKRSMAKTHNQMLKTRKDLYGDDYRLLPYMVDEETLERKRTQPKFIRNITIFERDIRRRLDFAESERRDEADRRICRGELIGGAVIPQLHRQKCYFLHHGDPYLKLGPLQMEKILDEPFRMVFRNFLSEKEIKWLLDYSRPRLSTARDRIPGNRDIGKHDHYSKKVKIVAKTVQVFIPDIMYLTDDHFTTDNKLITNPDPYSFKILNPVLYKLAQKVEIATRMTVLPRFSATQFQVTSYGLSGLCESHLDPHGAIEGLDVPKDRQKLHATGDMLATFMAWLEDVGAGGATAYDRVGSEQVVWPARGSAAFWMNLDRKGHRDFRSSHMGCPILQGSKWILNKWIYIYDQFKEFPCSLDAKEYFSPFSKIY